MYFLFWIKYTVYIFLLNTFNLSSITTHLLPHSLFEVIGEDTVRGLTDHCKNRTNIRNLSKTSFHRIAASFYSPIEAKNLQQYENKCLTAKMCLVRRLRWSFVHMELIVDQSSQGHNLQGNRINRHETNQLGLLDH